MKLIERIVIRLSLGGLVLAVSCTEQPEKKDNSVLIEAKVDSVTNSEEKTDVETVIEATRAVINAGQELVDEKRRRDSIKMANREKLFAYQLGLPLKNKQLVIDAYKKLSDTEGIRVLKKSKREFLLIKFEGKEEAELLAELDEYISDYGEEITGAVKIIDLVRECGRHKKPVQDKGIEERRGSVFLDCLTCNSD